MKTTVDNKDLIDRKTASRLLKVSIRTIDRYRQSGVLSTQIVNNKILLSRSDAIELLERQSRQSKYGGMSMDRRRDTEDKSYDSAHRYGEEMPHYDDTIVVDTEKTPIKSRKRDVDSGVDGVDMHSVYKSMYEEMSQQLHQKQQELEVVKYRIGLLEAQLRYTVPLAEHKHQTTLLLESGESLKAELEEKIARIKKLREIAYYEKLNKRIYLALVIVLALIQPLWLLLRNL